MAFTTIWGTGRGALLGALLLLGAGCRKDSYSELVNYTFDDKWEATKDLSNEQAYSGTFSAKAVGPTDTLRFRFPGKLLGPVRHVRLSAQVWLAHSLYQYPPLQIEVWQGKERVYVKSLWLNRVVWRYEQWVPVSVLLSLPEMGATDELRLSLALNQPDFKVYLDDLTLDNAE